MASKRTRTESEGIHASRQGQIHSINPKPSKRPRQAHRQLNTTQLHASSVNAVKKSIRDVSRRLARSGDLPADVRADDERALAAYQQALVDAEAEKKRQKMIRKYHMVRFFERKKATRELKRLRKDLLLAKSPEDIDEIKSLVHIAEVDLNYTQYHPLSERYISLYPQTASLLPENGSAQKTSVKDKPPIWAEVERRMPEGTLEKLRNRSPASSLKSKTVSSEFKRSTERVAGEYFKKSSLMMPSAPGKSTQVSKTQQSPRVSQKPDYEADGDIESDGGFFEE